MNTDLFLIFPFIVVVTAIVMGTIARIAKQLMDQRYREKELQAGLHAAPAPQVTARLNEMEQRLRVLERIATDGAQGTALAAEIEALRGDSGTPLAMSKRTGEKVL
ncbi:MAG: hypothetical protein ABIT10_06400 [Alteraurantiacibacter sp.]